MIGIAPAIIYNSCSSQPAVSYKSMATVHSSEKTREYRKPHSGKTLAVLALLLVVVALGSSAIGSYPISLHDWWSLLTTPSTEIGRAHV